MPLTYTVSHRDRLVTATARGEVSAEEIGHCLVGMVEQGALGYAKLFDATEMQGAFSREQLLSFATFSKVQGGLRRLGPLAIVIRSPAQRARVELFVRRATVRRPVRLFHELPAARRWLDAPASDPS